MKIKISYVTFYSKNIVKNPAMYYYSLYFMY